MSKVEEVKLEDHRGIHGKPTRGHICMKSFIINKPV